MTSLINTAGKSDDKSPSVHNGLKPEVVTKPKANVQHYRRLYQQEKSSRAVKVQQQAIPVKKAMPLTKRVQARRKRKRKIKKIAKLENGMDSLEGSDLKKSVEKIQKMNSVSSSKLNSQEKANPQLASIDELQEPESATKSEHTPVEGVHKSEHSGTMSGEGTEIESVKEEMTPECRTCLQTLGSDNDLYYIFQTWVPPWEGLESTIAEALERVAQVQISDMDPHSKVICEVCCQKLHSACLFANLAQNSDNILQQRYPSGQQEDNASIDNDWPKPIQIDKIVPMDDQMEFEVKQEVLTDEENNYYANEDVQNGVADMEIKIEPELIQQPQLGIMNGEESPLPEENQEDLIQLQDLLGDVFTDSTMNLRENIPHAMDQRTSVSAASNILTSTSTEFPDLPNIPTSIVSITSSPEASDITPFDPTYRRDGESGIHDNSPGDFLFDTTPMPSPIPLHCQNCKDPYCTSCVDCIIPQVDYENIGTPSDYSHFSTNVPTPSSTASFRTKTFKNDKGKKRLVHKNNWVTVQRKLKKNTGKQFLNKKGKVVGEKQLKEPCTDKCRLKCIQKISHEQRFRIFKYFWRLGEKIQHWEFVIKYTKKIPKRRKTTELTKHDRQNTFQYFLPNADKNAVVVCKTMFLNTISLSERVVSTAWKKYDGQSVVEDDKRGRYEHVKRVYNKDMVKSVCDHVRCFPVVEAHYVRTNPNKLYLEGIESISRMYKLYSEWFDSSKYSSRARTERQYREIVNLNFNLALHRPKKDSCDICHVFQNKSTPTDEEKYVFSKHQFRKNKARDLKKADKHEAQTNKTVVAATFDFQKVLVTPYGEVSVLYYKRRLATSNFTVYDLSSKVGTCYMWHDGIAKRGSVEVSSCLLDFMEHHIERGIKEFRFWSDNCAGQNRNRIVFSLYLFVAKKFGVTVIHRFLEKGHTQNEGDSVHSTIERASRHKSIWDPEEWYCLARWAKSDGAPYVVKEIKQEEVFDFKTLLANKNWTKNTANQKVMWTTIREVKVNAEQFDRIEYKYDFDDVPKTIVVIRAGKRNKKRLANEFDLKRAYHGHLPISKDKYKDLTDLCRTGIIPDRFHSFYINLPNTDDANW